MWTRDPGIDELIEYFDRREIRAGGWERLASKPGELKVVMGEIERSRKDFSYASRNYFWITNKYREDVPFKLWPSQELLLEKVNELKAKNKPQKLIILKARQLGFSTLIEAMIAWRTIFYSNVNSLIVSHAPHHAAFLFTIMTHILEKLPWFLAPMIRSHKIEEGLVLENADPENSGQHPGLNSRVVVQAANQLTGVGQGYRISACHASEIADWDDNAARQILEGDLAYALADNVETFAFIETTAKGSGRYFHKMWENQVELGEEAEWMPCFFPAFMEKGRTVVVLPENWKPDDPEITLRNKIRAQWLQCDNPDCARFRETVHNKINLSDSLCPVCRKGIMTPYELTNGQLAWMKGKRLNAQKDLDSLKEYHQELCVAGEARVSIPKFGILELAACSAEARRAGYQWHYNGEKETVLVRTYLGRELICTEDHQIALANGGWVTAQESSSKMIQLFQPQFALNTYHVKYSPIPSLECSIEINEQMGLFLGYFMGDGCYGKDRIDVAIDAKDEDVVEEIVRVLEATIGRTPRVTRKGGMVLVSSSCVKWKELLIHLGAIKLWDSNQWGYKRNVCVPECIFRSPRPVVANFLSALFECDGHAYKEAVRTKLFTKYDEFARDVQLLLLGFGINAHITKATKQGGGKLKQRSYTGNEVTLKCAASNEFHARIGFRGARKKSGLVRGPSKMGKPGFQNLMEDAVVSVSPAGERSVYDMTVPVFSSYSANGVMVHNCSTPEESFQLSGVQVFPYDAMEWARDCVESYAPIAHGFMDREGVFHGISAATGRCPVQSCDVDHSYDDMHTTLWNEPERDANYTLGVDVAEGLGGEADYSTIFVNKISQYGAPDEQVALFRSNTIDPVSFAFPIVALGKWYNEAMVSIEVNKYDTTFTWVRNQLQYSNLYRWKHVDSTNPHSNKWGWETNLKSRPRLYQTATKFLKAKMWIVKSKNFYKEMQHFQKEDYEDRRVEHSLGEYDDELIAGMISLYCSHDLDYDDNLGFIPIRKTGGDLSTYPWVMSCLKCNHAWGSTDPTSDRHCRKCFSPYVRGDRQAISLIESSNKEWEDMTAEPSEDAPPSGELLYENM